MKISRREFVHGAAAVFGTAVALQSLPAGAASRPVVSVPSVSSASSGITGPRVVKYFYTYPGDFLRLDFPGGETIVFESPLVSEDYDCADSDFTDDGVPEFGVPPADTVGHVIYPVPIIGGLVAVNVPDENGVNSGSGTKWLVTHPVEEGDWDEARAAVLSDGRVGFTRCDKRLSLPYLRGRPAIGGIDVG